LAPLSTETIEISIQTPASPGELLRTVSFTAADHPELVWQVSLSGQVKADVWAEPSAVDVVLSPGESVNRLVAVRHSNDAAVGRIKSYSPAVRILDSWPVENGRMVKLEIELPEGIDAFPEENKLLVFTEESNEPPCLEIPVVCKARPTITFFPEVLKLDLDELSQQSTESVRQTVLITLPASSSTRSLDVDPLVSWIEAEIEPISDSDYVVSLVITPQRVPNDLSTPILSVTMTEGSIREPIIQEFYLERKPE
jgi:hypothetical protein